MIGEGDESRMNTSSIRGVGSRSRAWRTSAVMNLTVSDIVSIDGDTVHVNCSRIYPNSALSVNVAKKA